MRLKVVACGVFEPYIEFLAPQCASQIDTLILDAGLHARPHDLRLQAQGAIDAAAREGGFDAVVLFYGLCGQGAAGLIARDVPIVIPRAHDCITLFLGSPEAYLRQFHRTPGTFYSTLGWVDKKTHPKNREAGDLYRNYFRDGYEHHPAFGDMAEQYGADNAKHVLAFLDRWRQHYTRAAYIDLGLPGEEEYAALTRQMAEVNGWNYEAIRGDLELMRAILDGNWDERRVFVLPPGHRSASTGDDRVLAAATVDERAAAPEPDSSDAAPEPDATTSPAREPGKHPTSWCANDPAQAGATAIGLGIDAGGTYTDAVLWDLRAARLLAKAKSLTTYHDLVEGIRGALGQLPADLLQRVEITSLSTTLATNSIVEGRGHRVGLIVLAPWEWFATDIGHAPYEYLPASVDIMGEVLEELDEDACRKAVDRLIEQEHCAALVVAGYCTIRNPAQANRVREIIRERAKVPVICAHEVSRRLNGIQCAQTAVTNARLLPVIEHLLDSVHRALGDFSVPGKLTVVKGDGTPVDESIARARPIETILSGPAASVSGARILTGLDDALVMDVGGTTTDCAILQNGRVAVAPEGARVGQWVMSVDVVEMSTVGLGGDSRIDFTRERDIVIGPTRNLPLAYVASEHPSVRRFLERFDRRHCLKATDASALDVLIAGGAGNLGLTAPEAALMALVAQGPIPAIEAAARLGTPNHKFLPLARLEQAGMVKRCALTPTDLLHVSGEFERWDAEASRLALELWAEMFGRPVAEVMSAARKAVTRRMFEEVVRREVSHDDRRLHDLPDDWRFLLDRAFEPAERGLKVRFSLDRPLIAIGAPAGVLAGPVREHLDAEVIVPEDADVANAIGAIATEVSVTDEVLIQPGLFSNYVLHGIDERMEFSELQHATETAVAIARQRARDRAIAAGAQSPEVTVTRRDSNGLTSSGGSIFLERRVVATASGSAFVG